MLSPWLHLCLNWSEVTTSFLRHSLPSSRALMKLHEGEYISEISRASYKVFDHRMHCPPLMSLRSVHFRIILDGIPIHLSRPNRTLPWDQVLCAAAPTPTTLFKETSELGGVCLIKHLKCLKSIANLAEVPGLVRITHQT